MKPELRIVGENSFEPLFLTKSPAVLRKLDDLREFAATDEAFLITGSTGTGKTLLAEEAHRFSPRSGRPFVVVDCPSLTKDLFESIVFGHVKGAFTGAVDDHVGLIEQADGGTVFFDEVAELSLGHQVKLLRCIENKVVRRVGSREEKAVNVRWICATNRDLRGMIRRGEFREDLYYRLKIWELQLPPLGERLCDVELIAQAYFRKLNQSLEERLTPEALVALSAYNWPGNVRQLLGVLKSANSLSRGNQIDVHQLHFEDFAPIVDGEVTQGMLVDVRVGDSLAVAGRKLAQATYRSTSYNKARTASMLGISFTTLRRRFADLFRNRGEEA